MNYNRDEAMRLVAAHKRIRLWAGNRERGMADQLAAAVAEIDRLTIDLARANDAAAKGDEARAILGGMEMEARSRYVGGRDVSETQTFGGRRTLRQMGDASDGGE